MTFATAVLLGTPAAGQSPPTPLGPPDAVFPEPFSLLRGLRELADGRVLVTDWTDQRVLLIDARFAGSRPVGRVGAGPEEFRLPAGLLPWRGDSTLLSDVGNARLAVIAPDGRIARTIAADRPGLGYPGGADRAGRIYFTIPAWSRQDQRLPPDTVEVVRLDPATGRTEPVATVKGSTRPRNQGPRRTPGFPFVAFAAQDAWRVAEDGVLVVVRAGDYRVERVGGSTVRGPSHAYAAEPVRPTDRRAFVEDFTASSPSSGRGPGGGMGHTPKLSEAELRQMVETNEFAEVLPPFDPARVFLAPDGEVWAQRGRHAGEPAVYDRFDASGRRVGQVRVDGHRTVAGVGRRHLYVIAADADGLQTLERYRRPT